jgi:hypothetical protein
MDPLPALSLGSRAERARGALAPLARFAHALYAQDADGRIVCFVPETGGDGPIHARLAGPLPPPETPLILPRGAIWTPPPPPRWTAGELAAGIARARARRPLRAPHLANAAYAAGLDALARWRAGRSPVEACRALIGLGPGLTPSGDDALGGAAIALHVFGARAAAESLAKFLRATAPGRTSGIAWAFLDAACDGEGTSRFHEALAALIDGGDFGGLDAMGHSSGWDAMDGALAVLELTASR